ncbi:hypothetical protein [Halococcus salsus]|uniref:hypothetical protein n=1 Tax=Halococcus salsus TaxID=2162894 RepID=UPI001359121F|nr:hypothetical protein [Halococcus salsus]
MSTNADEFTTAADGSYDRETAPTRDCPGCGNTLYFRRMLDPSNKTEQIHYEGYFCADCSLSLHECDICGELHNPHVVCAAQQQARLEDAQTEPVSYATIPGVGTVEATECEMLGLISTIYVEDGGCPRDGCDGDLVHLLNHTDDFPEADFETTYEAVGEYCEESEGKYGFCPHAGL